MRIQRLSGCQVSKRSQPEISEDASPILNGATDRYLSCFESPTCTDTLDVDSMIESLKVSKKFELLIDVMKPPNSPVMQHIPMSGNKYAQKGTVLPILPSENIPSAPTEIANMKSLLDMLNHVDLCILCNECMLPCGTVEQMRKRLVDVSINSIPKSILLKIVNQLGIAHSKHTDIGKLRTLLCTHFND